MREISVTSGKMYGEVYRAGARICILQTEAGQHIKDSQP